MNELAPALFLWYSAGMKTSRPILIPLWIILVFAGTTVLPGAACGMRPKPALENYSPNPDLWQAVTGFYDFLKLKQLDGYYDQPDIRARFPSQEAYYDFLDTVLPPMRSRRFEQNRILAYTVRSINPSASGDSTSALLKITFLSDDVLPFGKVVTVEQQWLRGPQGWFPGKVQAPKAGFGDKIR